MLNQWIRSLGDNNCAMEIAAHVFWTDDFIEFRMSRSLRRANCVWRRCELEVETETDHKNGIFVEGNN